jgi:hypothetical protein
MDVHLRLLTLLTPFLKASLYDAFTHGMAVTRQVFLNLIGDLLLPFSGDIGSPTVLSSFACSNNRVIYGRFDQPSASACLRTLPPSAINCRPP